MASGMFVLISLTKIILFYLTINMGKTLVKIQAVSLVIILFPKNKTLFQTRIGKFFVNILLKNYLYQSLCKYKIKVVQNDN